MKSKNMNVLEYTFFIRKAAMQGVSCDLFLLSCWKYSEYIVVIVVGFVFLLTKKKLTERDHF